MEQIYEKIQAYINHELKGEALIEFEEAVKKDKKLAAEVDFAQKMKIVFQNKETLRISALIHTIQQENPVEPDFDYEEEGFDEPEHSHSDTPSSKMPDDKTSISHSVKAKWVLGLLFSGLIVVLTLWGTNQYQTQQTRQLSHLFLQDSTLSYYPNIFSNNPANPILAEGMTYYNNRNFEKAAFSLSEYLKNELNEAARTPVELYLGICQNFSGQTDLAIPNLKTVINDTTRSMLHDIAHWHIALAYLAKGDKNTAKKELSLLKDNSIYKEKAEDLLQKL